MSSQRVHFTIQIISMISSKLISNSIFHVPFIVQLLTVVTFVCFVLLRQCNGISYDRGHRCLILPFIKIFGWGYLSNCWMKLRRNWSYCPPYFFYADVTAYCTTAAIAFFNLGIPLAATKPLVEDISATAGWNCAGIEVTVPHSSFAPM